MLFKEINIDSFKELRPFFDLVNYEACEIVLQHYICGEMYITQIII